MRLQNSYTPRPFLSLWQQSGPVLRIKTSIMHVYRCIRRVRHNADLSGIYQCSPIKNMTRDREQKYRQSQRMPHGIRREVQCLFRV
jgi:hypothetical protein